MYLFKVLHLLCSTVEVSLRYIAIDFDSFWIWASPCWYGKFYSTVVFVIIWYPRRQILPSQQT